MKRPSPPSSAALRARRNEKWSSHPPAVLPADVAELDFPPPDAVRGALRALLDAGDLGYPPSPAVDEEVREILAGRLRATQGWEVPPGRVELVTDVVQGISLALQALTAPGDAVVVQPPVYPPFFTVVRDLGREVLTDELVPTPEGYRMDLGRLRAALTPRTRALLLCNPHNPTGRVFTRAELAALAELALERDLFIVSDEVYADLAHPPHVHMPVASLDEAVAARTVTVVSAAKAFNFPGLSCAQMVFGGGEAQRRFRLLSADSRGALNRFSLEATLAAYRHGAPWLAEVRRTLAGNRQRVADLLARHPDLLAGQPPEGTFLAWLDCRRAGLPDEPAAFFLREARVALTPGTRFGPGGEGFARLNFGTPPDVLDAILERMSEALARHAAGRLLATGALP